jgi:glycosyltransferase involved in cell wall biosynthesis
VDPDAGLSLLVEDRRPDVIVDIDATGHLHGAPAAERAGVPAVWWRHLTPRDRPTERTAATLPVAAVVCPTAAAVEGQRRLTPDAPIVRIPPGLPITELERRAAEGQVVRREVAGDDHHLVGIVARVDPAKGQDLFLFAAAEMARRRPDVRFVVVGDDTVGFGPDLVGQLRRLAATLGVDDRVHFAGHVDDPTPWQAALDVAVQAAGHEAFGRSMVECLALGVPVVATDADGPRYVLTGDAGGLLVPRGDVRGLADATESLLDDPARAARLGAVGRRRARDFSEEQMAAAFAELLHDVRRRAPATSVPTAGATWRAVPA